MKRYKIKYRNVALLVLALSFLMFTMSGLALYRTRAELTPMQESYVGELDVARLNVELLENGNAVDGELLADLEIVEPGKTYEEEIKTSNTTEVNEYVRVIVQKYWLDKDGNKDGSLDPELIKLSYNDGYDTHAYNESNWKENKAEATKERHVYYLNESLKGNTDSPALFTHVTIDKEIATTYTIDESQENVIKYVYQYDGYSFVIKVEAQSVQCNHGTKAIKSVWGVSNVTADDGSQKLSIN